MSCPEGSTMNAESKMCMMPPTMTCPTGYTLVNGMCEPAPAATQQAAPEAPAPAPAPVAPAPVAPAGMEPMCPSGYEYRDSMCYPLPN
jgi:hypothetical protein